jgi:16S rRNA (guanine1207-N2)-methyltransferase
VNDAVRAIRANQDALGDGPLLLLDVPPDQGLLGELPEHVVLASEATGGEPPWTEPPWPCRGALVVASRSRRRLACLLQIAASRLEPGGTITLVASNTGAGGALAELATLGAVRRLAPKAHHRVAQVVITEPPSFDLADWRTSARTETPVGPLNLVWYPGVFAEGHLDPASSMLMEHLPEHAGRSLDIGTGCGVLLAALAMRSERAEGSEVDHFAARATLDTLEANDLPMHGTLSGRLPDVAPDETGFDLIVSNPPFHAGARTTTATANALIRDAFGVLTDDGQFLLVANRFLPYDRVFDEVGACEIIAEDGRYRVWRAWRPAHAG